MVLLESSRGRRVSQRLAVRAAALAGGFLALIFVVATTNSETSQPVALEQLFGGGNGYAGSTVKPEDRSVEIIPAPSRARSEINDNSEMTRNVRTDEESTRTQQMPSVIAIVPRKDGQEGNNVFVRHDGEQPIIVQQPAAVQQPSLPIGGGTVSWERGYIQRSADPLAMFAARRARKLEQAKRRQEARSKAADKKIIKALRQAAGDRARTVKNVRDLTYVVSKQQQEIGVLTKSQTVLHRALRSVMKRVRALQHGAKRDRRTMQRRLRRAKRQARRAARREVRRADRRAALRVARTPSAHRKAVSVNVGVSAVSGTGSQSSSDGDSSKFVSKIIGQQSSSSSNSASTETSSSSSQSAAQSSSSSKSQKSSS